MQYTILFRYDQTSEYYLYVYFDSGIILKNVAFYHYKRTKEIFGMKQMKDIFDTKCLFSIAI